MKSLLKSTLMRLVLIIVGTSLLSGCNTVKGFGQDLQEGGKKLQQEADS